MNSGISLFLGTLVALFVSWSVFVGSAIKQIGQLPPEKDEETGSIYPVSRDGLANQGREVYRTNGCIACHSQQLRQTGFSFDVMLQNGGTNKTEAVEIIAASLPRRTEAQINEMLQSVPVPLAEGINRSEADALMGRFDGTDVKVKIEYNALGADVERGGWGTRRTVARDYLYDNPAMIGSQRIGPDLSNAGGRGRTREWHLIHLYNPRIHDETRDSVMPPYPFLFEEREIRGNPSPDALQLPDDFAPEAGTEIVPTQAALALVEYLLSLRVETALVEAPMARLPEPDLPVPDAVPAVPVAPAQ